MNILRSLALALILGPLLLSPAAAHSLKEVEQQLSDKGQPFASVDRAAPEFTLLDAKGRSVCLSNLRGKVVVLNFACTTCAGKESLHAKKIARLQGMVNLTPMQAQVVFVTVAIDPEQSRTEAMQTYGASAGLGPINWTLLTALPDQPSDSTRDLATAYGRGPGADTQSTVTHLIDQDGRLRAQFYGLEFEPAGFVVYVNALLNRAQNDHPHGDTGLWSTIKKML